MNIQSYNLIWLDLEMTGLNPAIDKILEIATLITDNNFNILAEGPVLAINQYYQQLTFMNKWNLKIHRKNGLLQRVINSPYTENIVENITVNFLKKWVDSNISPLCGNSINQDRRFLYKYMPKLESYFNYRSIDVSSIKEVIKRFSPQIFIKFKKKHKHSALSDIKESVKELIFYRKFIKY